jgi:hypothetical protein
MTQPTEPFAQHLRLAELVTALGFRRGFMVEHVMELLATS